MLSTYKLSIPDLVVFEPNLFADDRGFFYESYNKQSFDNVIKQNINFVQDNQSRSLKGVLRGLHYQQPPYEQGKLVRVTSGEVFDVAVDLRPNSEHFGKFAYEYLSSENNKQLWIPEGFAHGFLVLSDYADFLYKTTKFYNPKSEITIKWDDPSINIPWPNIRKLSSMKDHNGMSFKDFVNNL